MDYDTFSIPSNTLSGYGNTLGMSFEGMSGGLGMSDNRGHMFPRQPNYMVFGMLQVRYLLLSTRNGCCFIGTARIYA